MMATMRLISSTPEAYHTYHFYRGDVGAMLPPKICYNQSINIFIANSQLSIIIYYTAKNRAPKFYAGLLQILCWEPGGLPSFKVSGDPCYRTSKPASIQCITSRQPCSFQHQLVFFGNHSATLQLLHCTTEWKRKRGMSGKVDNIKDGNFFLLMTSWTQLRTGLNGER